MVRRWSLFGGWLGAACLLMLAGCVPVRRGGHEPPDASPPATPKATVNAEAKSPQAPGAEAPRPQTDPAGSPKAATYRLTADDPLVAARITLYQQKKSDWDATTARLAELAAPDARPQSWNQCQQDIELALAGYLRLQMGEEREVNPWETLGRDLDYFDRECDQVLSTAQKNASGPQGLSPAPVPDSTTSQLQHAFESGQYQEVVTAYETLPKGNDGTLPGPRQLKILYSRALIKLDRLQEAADTLTRLMAEVNQPMDQEALDTRVLTADLLLATGQVEESRQVYEGVATALAPIVSQQEWVAANVTAFAEPAKAGDLETYRQLLQAYLRFDGRRVPPELIAGVATLQGQQNESFTALAKILLTKAMAQSQTWAREQLAEIRGVLATHDLVRARELLQQLSSAAPDTMQPAISQLESELGLAELAAQESPTTGETGQAADPWAGAVSLFEQQKYDEAIAEFQKFLDGEHDTEARAKIAEASDLAAAAMRRQAAALYAKAKNTFDPEARRQGLLSSRTLLLALIEKYPASSIVDKARQNLKVLEVELGRTSPPIPASIVP